MSSATLKLCPPSSMNFDDVLLWITSFFKNLAEKCGEAKAFYRQLEVYHEDVAELTRELAALKQKGFQESEEEIRNIVETVNEIFEAITSLTEGNGFISNDSISIDDYITEVSNSDPEEVAKAEAQRGTFLEKYNHYKSKLGLATQEAVASQTGIDRRYISLLESGKHKPQFKTLKKIADAFGVDIKDLS